MTRKRAEVLLVMMDGIEGFTLQRAWTGLADDEFFWEPVADMWSIRPRVECRTATPFGHGDWVADFDDAASVAAQTRGEIEPLTTIAWLLWHIGSLPGRLAQLDFFGGDHALASGWTSPYLCAHPMFTTARDAARTLRAGWDDLRAALDTSDDEGMERRIANYSYAPEPRRDGFLVLGPPGQDMPAFAAVALALNEISHHATQVCVLRDLYRWAR